MYGNVFFIIMKDIDLYKFVIIYRISYDKWFEKNMLGILYYCGIVMV